MQGRIQIRNWRGKGARFTILLVAQFTVLRTQVSKTAGMPHSFRRIKFILHSFTKNTDTPHSFTKTMD